MQQGILAAGRNVNLHEILKRYFAGNLEQFCSQDCHAYSLMIEIYQFYQM